PQKVDFSFAPSKVGRLSLEARVAPDPDERNTGDNAATASLLVTDTEIPLLYIEGHVRTEIRMLTRAVGYDPNINATSMIQGQAGQLAITHYRENRPDDDLAGIPQNLAQWKRYKVIILGDLDPSFLSPQQQRDLEEAVRAGTGLL